MGWVLEFLESSSSKPPSIDEGTITALDWVIDQQLEQPVDTLGSTIGL